MNIKIQPINKRQILALIMITITFNCDSQETTTGRYRDIIPDLAVKTNLLYDATTSLNLSIEYRLSKQLTLDFPVSYNPWTFGDNKKWKHLLFQPEARWWIKNPFAGHFFGLHAHYAYYNVGGLSNPPFSEYMHDHRFEGWLAGAGFSYGYQYRLSPRWSLEATIGLGYAYLDYEVYPCKECSEKLGKDTRNYWGLTKAGINLIYFIQ